MESSLKVSPETSQVSLETEKLYMLRFTSIGLETIRSALSLGFSTKAHNFLALHNRSITTASTHLGTLRVQLNFQETLGAKLDHNTHRRRAKTSCLVYRRRAKTLHWVYLLWQKISPEITLILPSTLFVFLIFFRNLLQPYSMEVRV